MIDDTLLALVPTIVDEQLAGVRARFAERHAAERQRQADQLAREASRAWWRWYETRHDAGKVLPMRRLQS
jgi:hypothetical protein